MRRYTASVTIDAAPASPPPSQTQSDSPASRGLVARWVGSWKFWVIAVGLLMAFPIVRTVLIQLPPPLPVLGQLPRFEFTSQAGRPFGSDQLKGKVWVANFIFTRCPTICPAFTAKMRDVQHRTRNMGDAIHLVSFSVDPEYDQPAVLAEYAQRFQANPRRWTFLTGDLEQMRQTVVDGFKVTMGKAAETSPDDVMSIFHGTHFVLVDAEGRIRGYYQSDDKERVDALVRDLGLLVNRGE